MSKPKRNVVNPIVRWGALWRSRNRVDGLRRYILCGNELMPAMFRTRREAREWIEAHYGYIRKREDLKAEPHGWMLPTPVRLSIEWLRRIP